MSTRLSEKGIDNIAKAFARAHPIREVSLPKKQKRPVYKGALNVSSTNHGTLSKSFKRNDSTSRLIHTLKMRQLRGEAEVKRAVAVKAEKKLAIAIKNESLWLRIINWFKSFFGKPILGGNHA